MTKTVIGSFDAPSDAQAVLNALTLEGFDRSDIDILDASNSGDNLQSTLSGMGVPRSDASWYAENVRRGGSTVIVKTDDAHAQLADDIMHRNRVIDIDSRTEEWRQSGWTDEETHAASREGVIPVVEEELHVGKREVDHGGVRVYSRTVETPVQEDVSLREERVSVERRPVDRPATEADLAAGEEKTLEMRETSEEPVVEKSARVVEEVELRKDVQEHTENVRDTVRRTEVEVDEKAAKHLGSKRRNERPDKPLGR